VAGYRRRLALPRASRFPFWAAFNAHNVYPNPESRHDRVNPGISNRYFKPVNDGDMLIDYRVAMSPITYGPIYGCTSTASA